MSRLAKTAKTKKQAATKTQTPENLYDLLAGTALLDDEERQFWLARYERLAVTEQYKLVKKLESAEQELKKEEETHQSRMAEIFGKYETEVKLISDENNLEKIEIKIDSTEAKSDELFDEELLAQLEQFDSN